MDQKHYTFSWVFSGLVLVVLPLISVGQDTPYPHLQSAYDHLNMVMDQFHTSLDVYTDLGAAGNHFAARCAMAESNNVTGVAMDEGWTQQCHSGGTCIKNTFSRLTSTYWGGWYFQNGVLLGIDTQPRCNWGIHGNAGIDLTGATSVTFWARGEQGGERIEFFVGGVGRNAFNGRRTANYPDSFARVPGVGQKITLSTDWQRYTIDLRGKDLSYVLGGFAWVANVPNNPKGAIFYLDDIRYEKVRLDDLRFPVSFQTLPDPAPPSFDTVLQNVAFVYDNAVVLLAYLARGTVEDLRRAQILAEAFVYAHAHDRYYDDGRLRNAYQGGDLMLPPGWRPHGRVATARLPGWWDVEQRKWFESRDQVGTSTGNMAWVMIALLKAYQVLGDARYLDVAMRLGTWAEDHARDTQGPGGYTGGYEGWEPAPEKMTWKSTEHNLDLYVAFRTLAALTGDATWQKRALHARHFLLAMWQACGPHHFATGTHPDSVTPNCDFAPSDVNTWGLMALQDDAATYGAGVDWVQTNARVTEACFSTPLDPPVRVTEAYLPTQRDTLATGIDFNDDRDGIWWEGTAHTVIALRIIGEDAAADALLADLRRAQQFAPNANGEGLVATCHDGVSTGIKDFFFFNRLHIAATAWFAMAEQGHNPFWDLTNPVPLTITPASHDFGLVMAGRPSLPQQFTIWNRGEAPHGTETITVTGANAAAFTLQNDLCTGHLLPSATGCTFEVLLTPPHSERMSATLLVFSNHPEDLLNPMVTLSGRGVPTDCPTCFLSESFEAGWGDWSADNGLWEVGTPTAGPGACYQGSQCAGTVLSGRYTAQTDSRLISPAITLPTVTGGQQLFLRFWQWVYYTTLDQGYVQVAVQDPGTHTWSAWTTLGGPVQDWSTVWSLRSEELTAYAGKTIRLGWYHTAAKDYRDTATEGFGWYIDQITLIVQSSNPSVFLTTSPLSTLGE